jgi:uncharacterized membrane protein YdjX (TVP38/TMEM64 family)
MCDSSSSSSDPSPPSSPGEEEKTVDYAVEAKKIFRRLGPASILAVISVSFPLLGMLLLLGTMSEYVGPWLESQGRLGVAVYIAGFALLAGLALMPTWVQAVLGGWAFKMVTGSIAAISGYGLASIIGYVIAWRASGQRVVEMLEEKPKWRAVYDTLLRSGFGKTLLIITLIRIPPNSPFALTNLVLAATRVPPLAYILGTIIGMAPRTIVAVGIGANVKGQLDLSEAGGSWWGLLIKIAIALVVIAIIGHMANQAVAKVTAENGESAESAPSSD